MNFTKFRVCGLVVLSALLAQGLQGSTVFSTITPVTASEGTSASINLNGSLGPVTDSSDDIQFTVQDLGENSILTALGVNTGEIAQLGNFNVNRFEAGDAVDSTATYSPTGATLAIDNSIGLSLGNWGGGATAYVGIKFLISGATHYGFARVTWAPDNDGSTALSSATIDQIGFNTVAGAPAIIPAPVPEPSTAMLFCLAGFSLFRRKR
jgi:hypothetical protein